jgi:hypothetical protein
MKFHRRPDAKNVGSLLLYLFIPGTLYYLSVVAELVSTLKSLALFDLKQLLLY